MSEQTRSRSAREDFEELRELIREAHGATRDLAQLLREYRRAVADGTELAKKAASETASLELKRFGNHLQSEMNQYAASLNAAVQRAQKHITSCLTMAELIPDGDVLKVKFDGAPFDANVPMPYSDVIEAGEGGKRS